MKCRNRHIVCEAFLVLWMLPLSSVAVDLRWTIVEDPAWASLSINEDGLLDGPTGPQTDFSFLGFPPPANSLNPTGSLDQTFWNPSDFGGPPDGWSVGFGGGTFTQTGIDNPDGEFASYHVTGSLNTFEASFTAPAGEQIPQLPLSLGAGVPVSNFWGLNAPFQGVSEIKLDAGTFTFFQTGFDYYLPFGLDPFAVHPTDIAEHFSEVAAVLNANGTQYDFLLLQLHDIRLSTQAFFEHSRSTTAFGVVVPIPPSIILLASAIASVLFRTRTVRS